MCANVRNGVENTLLSDGAYKGFHNLRLLKLKITIINKHLNKCTNLRWRQHVFQDPFVNNSVLIFWVLYCIKIIPRHRLHVCCKVYDRVRRRPATPVPAHTCPHAARAGKWRGNEYSEPRVGGHGHTLLPAHWRFWWQQPRIIFLLAKMVENYPLSTIHNTHCSLYIHFFLRWKSRVSTEIPRHTHWHGRACSQWMLDPCIKLHFTFDNTTPSVFTICHLKSNLRRLCVESILTFVNGKYRGTLKVHSLLSTIQCTEVFHKSKSMII